MTGKGSRRLDPPWWDHQRHPLRALRVAIERLLVARVWPSQPVRVVDLGAGDAPYRPLFQARGVEYLACDLDGDTDVRIEPGQPVDLPAGCADGVVSFQVLEHVWDLEWYLGEARRLLRPGGWLMLSTHGTWPYHPHPTDFRRWTEMGLRGELEKFGFVVETVDGIVGPLAWTTQIRLLGFREGLRRVPIFGRPLVAALALVMNARMAVEDAVTPHSVRQENACVYVTFSQAAAA